MLILAVLSCLLVAPASPCVGAETALPSYDRVRVLQPARRISDTELIDQDGRAFRLGDLNGRVVLLFFGFTHCPDVCPLTLTRFQQLQDSGNLPDSRVAFVMISVDAERDTPAALKTYLARFSPDFIGLTGSPDRVKAAAKEFSVSFFKGNTAGADDDYTMAHSPQAFVLGPAGWLRAELYGASVDAMTGIVTALLSETRN